MRGRPALTYGERRENIFMETDTESLGIRHMRGTTAIGEGEMNLRGITPKETVNANGKEIEDATIEGIENPIPRIGPGAPHLPEHEKPILVRVHTPHSMGLLRMLQNQTLSLLVYLQLRPTQ